MEFRILGRVEVWAGDHRVDLGPAESAKARCVLVVLLRSPGALVTAAALSYRVWDDPPPGPATRYKYVGWLRSALSPYGVVLTSTPEGYVLQVEPDQVDLYRFRRLVAEARESLRAHAAPRAASLLDEALRLWRGPALAGLSGSWADLFRDQLEGERKAATVLRAYAELERGRAVDLIAELAEWECENPTDEVIAGLRMLALYRCGRRGEALACFRRAQRRIRAAVDADLSPELQKLARRIQAGDPVLATGALEPGLLPGADVSLAVASPVSPLVVPRQLPAAPRQFAGRVGELAALTALAAGAGREGTVVISAVDGTAGIGKTALALYWAHRVADEFSDGQLYVNLHGFDPSRAPMTPGEAIQGFLAAFAVPPEQLPPSPQAQAGLYRSLLAGRRVLIVLDNARDADQVAPLLPGSAGCMVIVTSRNRLSGLLAGGAHPLTLDLLTVHEARELLSRHLGAERIAGEPQAVDDLIRLCARLPLALSIAAGQAATRPTFPLSTLVTDLRSAQSRLDALDGGDTGTNMRAVFSWSYRQLRPAAARLFRLLGLHPGPDITVPAAAGLLGEPADTTRVALTELTRTHLVVEYAPGRYTFHDLLRVYAAELAADRESGDERDAAVRRILDHYLHTAYAAARRLDPHLAEIALLSVRPHAAPEQPASPDEAQAWFVAERAVLLATLRSAADRQHDAHVWQLAWSLKNFLERQGNWRDYAEVQHAALAAAQRLGDRAAQAHAHRCLARVFGRLRRLDDAYSHLRHALALYSELGDADGQASTHLSMGVVFEPAGRYQEGLRHARQALVRYQEAGNRAGQARALNTVGWCHALLGQERPALDYCRQALELHRGLGDWPGEAATWDSLGYVHHRLGDTDEAIGCYRRSIALHRAVGDRYNETINLGHLGEVYRSAEQPDEARKVWLQALAILDDLHHADAGPLRAKLRSLPAAPRRPIHPDTDSS